MSDNSKLKPCPFCGADARELAHDQIECSNIECVSFRYMALSFPRELWNTRATSSDASELAKDDLLKNIESALEHGNESHCFVSTSLLVQLQNLIVDQKYTITRLENERDELVDTLSELHNLMEDTISGEYKPDYFTCQPARIILAKYQSVKGSDSK